MACCEDQCDHNVVSCNFDDNVIKVWFVGIDCDFGRKEMCRNGSYGSWKISGPMVRCLHCLTILWFVRGVPESCLNGLGWYLNV